MTSTTRNKSGAYSFDLQPGKYLVCDVLASSFTQSAPPVSALSLHDALPICGFKVTVTSSGTFAGNDFGNYTTGKVSGHKYEDPNADGDLSDGTGLSGWTIKVYTETARAHVLTPATQCGRMPYTFDMQPGKYLVCEVLEASFTQSAQPGTDCLWISDAADGGFNTPSLHDALPICNDFGNYTTGKVSGHKYEDPNADGDLSDGTGLSGWTIKVYTDAATPVFVTSTTTNGDRKSVV